MGLGSPRYLSATIGQIRYFSIPRVTIRRTFAAGKRAARRRIAVWSNPLAGLAYLLRTRAPRPQPFPGQRTPPRTAKLGANAPGCQIGVITPGQIGVQYPASDIVSEISLTGL